MRGADGMKCNIREKLASLKASKLPDMADDSSLSEQDQERKHKKVARATISFVVMTVLLLILFFAAAAESSP